MYLRVQSRNSLNDKPIGSIIARSERKDLGPGIGPTCILPYDSTDRLHKVEPSQSEMTNVNPRFTLTFPFVAALVAMVILVAFVSTVGLLWLGWWQIAENRRLISSLSVPPGVERAYIVSHGNSKDEFIITPPESWSTLARFEFQDYSKDDLADFYIARLSTEWEYCMRNLVTGVWFVSDNYLVGLDSENAPWTKGSGSFDIHVSQDRPWNQCDK